MRNPIDMLWDESKLVEQLIEELNDELKRISAADAGCIGIRQIPGIGPLAGDLPSRLSSGTATFRKAREFAA